MIFFQHHGTKSPGGLILCIVSYEISHPFFKTKIDHKIVSLSPILLPLSSSLFLKPLSFSLPPSLIHQHSSLLYLQIIYKYHYFQKLYSVSLLMTFIYYHPDNPFSFFHFHFNMSSSKVGS